MSTRRPRIKASANLALASKRKPKTNAESVPTKPKEEPSDVQSKPQEDKLESTLDSDIQKPNGESPSPNKTPKSESLSQSHSGNAEIIEKSILPSKAQNNTSTIPIETPPIATESISTPICTEPIPEKSPEILQKPPPSSGKTLQSFEDAFKYPFNPDYKRPTPIVPPIEENPTPDFEDNILHMDLQKSPGFPMSPTKARQRIRPTPIFGQRRNSFVLTSPSPHTEDEPGSGTTRQRSSNSTSSDVSGNFLMRKLAVGNLGRIRTESGCSTVSESRGSSRKNHNDEINKTLKKEFQLRYNGGVPDKSTLKMFDLIYYNPTTNPMELKPSGGAAAASQANETSPDDPPDARTPAMTESAMPVPQLKLGSNGELMIDEMSLEIETTAEVEARRVLANTSLIYHDENTSGEGFYKKSKRTKDWQQYETIKFYRCLQTVGTDFSLMLTLFPNRTRRDLKLKFKKEERCNLNLINKALLYPGTFNIDDLKEKLDTEERERNEQEQLWKEIKSKEAKKTKKQSNTLSKTSRILTSGDEVYQNENITKVNLSRRAARKEKKKDDDEPKEKRQRKKKAKPITADVKNEQLNEEMNEILNLSDVETMDSIPESEGLNEASINLILNELANGTLALVSSEDLSNPLKPTINEIYIMCKETNTLSDRPLDLPEEIVDAIKAAISC